MADQNAPKTEKETKGPDGKRGASKKGNVVSFQFSSPTVDLELVEVRAGEVRQHDPGVTGRREGVGAG